MKNSLLDFSKYENINSKFNAKLEPRGGNITFSNSGKGGNKKLFSLSLDTFLSCLKDILKNNSEFKGHEVYNEKAWRDLGSKFFTDGPANAQITVQTKPMFVTLSKIIMWANTPKLDNNDPELEISLDYSNLSQAIKRLDELADNFSPHEAQGEIEKQKIVKSNSIRDFALKVFEYFFSSNWQTILDESKIKDSSINNTKYKIYDHQWFNNLIGEFDKLETKESLSSSNTLRYFEEPILINNGKYYYFTTQWNATGEYNLSFRNLKKFIENKFPNYTLEQEDKTFVLLSKNKLTQKLFREDFDLKTFQNSCKDAGLVYSDKLITRFVSSLLTKPFVILTGLSGSGKTKLAQAYVQWICQEESQYRIIPVGADWTNREPLLGYPNALKPEEYVKPDSGVIDLILQANSNPELPHFLILDEMNLSHVERYFADFLSVMESNEEIPLYAEGTVENGVPSKLKVPSNLFIIGTVNIDETTNMFSPKVLDRANTIEFRINNSEMEGFLGKSKELNMNVLLKDDKKTGKGATMAKSFINLSNNKSFTTKDLDEIKETLLNFFGELQKTGAEFGYRSASEILRLINQLDTLNSHLTTSEKLDIAIMQKLLPKLHGSRRKLSPILETLGGFCVTESKIVSDKFRKEDYNFSEEEVLFPMSLEKISRMYKGAVDNGFASYAEA